MADETAYDRFDAVLVNVRTALQDSGIIAVPLVMAYYLDLIMQWYLRVRDNESRHECMSCATFTATYATNAHTDRMREDLKSAEVISMDGKAGRMSAWAGKLVKLEIGDEVIISILYIYIIGIAIEGK